MPTLELARQAETDVAGLAADALGVVLVAAGLGSSTPVLTTRNSDVSRFRNT